jgi:ribosome biogenesis GTPase
MTDKQEKKGKILRGKGGLYWVGLPDAKTILLSSARGLFRKDRIIPTTGDQVIVTPSGDTERPWQIQQILPRRNYLRRPAIANLDGLIITVSVKDPEPDLFLVDKLLAICYANAIEPLLVVTKTDLEGDPDGFIAQYEPSGCSILLSSPQDDSAIRGLEAWLPGKIACLAGSSGVGKSSLLNRLKGSFVMTVGSVSERIGRGRQTTREVVLFPFAGGYLGDTPGFSVLELAETGMNGVELAQSYPEIARVSDQCFFNDCRHMAEPGCAVPDSGIHEDRLARYKILRTELDEIEPYQMRTRL